MLGKFMDADLLLLNLDVIALVLLIQAVFEFFLATITWLGCSFNMMLRRVSLRGTERMGVFQFFCDH